MKQLIAARLGEAGTPEDHLEVRRVAQALLASSCGGVCGDVQTMTEIVGAAQRMDYTDDKGQERVVLSLSVTAQAMWDGPKETFEQLGQEEVMKTLSSELLSKLKGLTQMGERALRALVDPAGAEATAAAIAEGYVRIR